MLARLFGTVGALSLALPRWVLERWFEFWLQRVFVDSTGCSVRPRAFRVARAGGSLAVTVGFERRGRLPAALLVGLLGVVELLAPGTTAKCGVRLLFETPEDAEVREWVRPAVRAKGGLLLLFARSGLRRKRSRETSTD
ncbi:hypothetical protein [Halomarina ordinaria]|uniref:DUF2953 domain-containing protein n=1 Tax=Halomarina ordinaria TaxID=3033939 RepID=A0ABD5U6L3_9EURY|nr:hypothetical protein [Halomarina sp. PSRA2]